MYCDHSIRHAMRTAENAVDFVNHCYLHFRDELQKLHPFGFEQDFYLSAIAGLLHDIGIVEGKQNHARRSSEMAEAYLSRYDLTNDEINIVSLAIRNHSDSDSIANLVSAAVLMGDKLDVSKGRMLAYYDEGLIPFLTPFQKALLQIKRARFFINESGHGALEWIISQDPTIESSDDDVKQLIDLAMQEWPKCITIPEKITSQFLNIPFSFPI